MLAKGHGEAPWEEACTTFYGKEEGSEHNLI